MTLRSKRLPGLLAILALLALAPSLFAQVTITINATPSASEIQTNHAAQTADASSAGAGLLITGQLLATSPLTTTVLLLTYSAPISSTPTNCIDTSLVSRPGVPVGGNPAVASAGATVTPCANFVVAPNVIAGALGTPLDDPIAIVGQSGVFASVSNPRLNTASKRIEIDLPGTGTGFPNSLSGSFRLLGVHLDLNGVAAPVTVTPSLASNAANYLVASGATTVIGAVGTGIGTATVGQRPGNPTPGTGGVSATALGTAAIFTNRTVAKATAGLAITTGFTGAWRSASQGLTTGGPTSTGAENSSRILLTFNNIPTGVTLTLSINPTVSTTSGKGSAAFLGAVSSCESTPSETAGPIPNGTNCSPTVVVNSTANTATVAMLSPSQSGTAAVEVDISAIALTSTAAVTTPGVITVTVTMAPVCASIFDANGLPMTSGGYPCFTEADIGPVTLVNIIPTSTTLLMPYALTLPPFDTGIAIANTTADSFGSTGGGAIPQNGTIKFDFFPTTSTGGAGTPFTVTTSSTVKPGSGLSSDGTLASGATFSALLSQLLTAAGQTGNFTGYVFITTNFLDAHGTATISDFRTYSLTANVLVVPPPATASRSTPAAGFESLNN